MVHGNHIAYKNNMGKKGTWVGSLYPFMAANWEVMLLLSASEGFPKPGIPAWIKLCWDGCSSGWAMLTSGVNPIVDDALPREWKIWNGWNYKKEEEEKKTHIKILYRQFKSSAAWTAILSNQSKPLGLSLNNKLFIWWALPLIGKW